MSFVLHSSEGLVTLYAPWSELARLPHRDTANALNPSISKSCGICLRARALLTTSNCVASQEGIFTAANNPVFLGAFSCEQLS